MQLADCYYLGTIVRTHGLKGHLVIKLDTDQPDIYENLESVFLDINGIPVPFFISECNLHNGGTLKIKFEDDSLDIQSLMGRKLYLPLNTLPKLEGKKFYYHEIIGFSLFDKQKAIGKIIEVTDQIAQPFFIVQISEKTEEEEKKDTEIIIPIINEWIIEVNRENKFISMNLPEGILDL